MMSGSGADRVYGEAGHDTIFAGRGNDHVFGGAGNDLLSGGEGRDQMYGGDHDDVIFGGNGSDNLFGEEGDDVLGGGSLGTEIDFANNGQLIFSIGDQRDWDIDGLWGDAGTDTYLIQPGLPRGDFVFNHGAEMNIEESLALVSEISNTENGLDV